jgi:hypothetical protein
MKKYILYCTPEEIRLCKNLYSLIASYCTAPLKIPEMLMPDKKGPLLRRRESASQMPDPDRSRL